MTIARLLIPYTGAIGIFTNRNDLLSRTHACAEVPIYCKCKQFLTRITRIELFSNIFPFKIYLFFRLLLNFEKSTKVSNDLRPAKDKDEHVTCFWNNGKLTFSSFFTTHTLCLTSIIVIAEKIDTIN